jgi:hypothetical protein
VVCPQCGEDNSDSFRFCGMCGTLLDARRSTGAPVTNPPAFTPKTANELELPGPVVVEKAAGSARNQVPSIAAPSMLGLDRPTLDRPGTFQIGPEQHRFDPSPTQPSMDSLRERSFSGLDSFLEPEQPKTGGRRILLLVVLLAALGAAGWWTYNNYLGLRQGRKPETTASGSEVPASPSAQQSTKPAPQDVAPAPDAGPSSAAAPPTRVPEAPPENATTASAPTPKSAPEPTRKTAESGASTKPESKPAVPRVALGDRSAEKSEPRKNLASAPKPPTPATPDNSGDADFRKGEAYLYGRGSPENCEEAVKHLKAASAKSSAKARSAFGTMYATGHCVARDLPTSYLWFAMALQVDPNNQILEKDLNAIWNQMTPPERQMATRMKQ